MELDLQQILKETNLKKRKISKSKIFLFSVIFLSMLLSLSFINSSINYKINNQTYFTMDSAKTQIVNDLYVIKNIYTQNISINGDLNMSGIITHNSPVRIREGIDFVNGSNSVFFDIELESLEHNETGYPALDGTLLFDTHNLDNPYGMEIAFWNMDNQRPELILSLGEIIRSSIFDRSLQIGKSFGNAPVDENYTLCQGYNLIDCATDITGADLGVEDDIEAKGSILAQENVTAELFIGNGSQLTDLPLNYNAQGSGWFSGGGLLHNPGTNTFNISTDINYVLVNQTDGNNLIINEYTFPATDNISIGTVINQERWVALSAYPNGSVMMDFLTLNLTADQRRDYAIVGRVWTDEDGFITGTGPYVEPAYGYGKTMEDLIVTLGASFNIEGNIFSANGVNMLLDKSGGEAFRYGAWSIDHPASPNIGSDPQVIGIDEYYYFTSDATEHNITTEIQTLWENEGVLEEMPSNKFQCQYIWHWSFSQVVAVQYGQRLYSKIEDAQAGCPTDEFNVNAELTSGAKLRSWLIFKTGTTDLSDSTTVDFLVAPNVWFGSGASGGGTSQVYIGDGISIYVETNGINIIHLNTTYTDDRYFNTPNETGTINLNGTFNVKNNLGNVIVSAGPTIGGVETDYGILNLYRSDGALGARINAGSSSSQPTHLQIPMGFGGNTVPRGHIDASSHNILAARLYLNPGGSGPYFGYPYARISIDGEYGGIRLGHSDQAHLDTMAASIDGGYIIYNTDTNAVEYFNGSTWISWGESTSNITEPISAANVSIALGGGSPTVDQMQEYIDNTGSAGFFLGGNLSDGGSGTVDVDAGEGFIRTSDDPNAQLQSFKWNDSLGIAIPDNTTQYVYVDNSGAISLSTDEFLEAPNKIKIGVVTDEAGSTVHTFKLGVRLEDGVGAAGRFLRRVLGIQRNNRLGGLILGQSGDANRDVTMSTGQLEWGRTSYPIASFNTAGADTFFTYSSSGLENSNATQFPNTQYDNSGTLTTMINNRWANLYFFLEPDDHLIMIYGRAQYVTEGQAENEGVPTTSLPTRVSETSILVGRFTFKKSADTATISSSFDTLFANAGVTSHNNLANLDYASAGHIGFMSDSGDIATGNYTFDTDTLFIDADNNRIGIGTTTPSGKLHLFSNTSGTTLNVESEYGPGGSVVDIMSKGNGTNWGEAQVILSTNQSENRWFMFMDDSSLGDLGDANRLGFWNGGSTVMVLDGDNERVGIGTTTPVTGLEVKAPIAGGSPFKGSLHLSYPTGLTSTGISMDSNISGVEQTWLMIVGSGAGNNNFRIFDSTLAIDRFNIQDGTGNVGIGTTTPNAKLQVDGNAIFGTTINISAINNLTLRGDSDAPNFPVYTIGFERSFWNPGENAAEIVFGRGGGAAGGDIRFNTQSISSNLTRRMHIAETGEVHIPGNVGIGTTSLSNQLHVYSPNNAGGITIDGASNPALTMSHDGIITGYLASVDGDGNYFGDAVINDTIIRGEFGLKLGVLGIGNSSISIDSSGLVGIGTDTPSTKLSVESNLNIFSPADTAVPRVEGIAFVIDSEAGDNLTDSRMLFVKNDEFVGSMLRYNPSSDIFSITMLESVINITEVLSFTVDGSLATIGTDDVKIDALAGSYGSNSAYVCVSNDGTLFASDSGCP